MSRITSRLLLLTVLLPVCGLSAASETLSQNSSESKDNSRRMLEQRFQSILDVPVPCTDEEERENCQVGVIALCLCRQELLWS